MQDGRQPIYRTKVCVIGSWSVGKTSIASRFSKDVFQSVYHPTVGGNFLTRKKVVENKTFLFQMWDTAGSERYRALVPMYLRDACAAVVVYDITNAESFNQLPYWLDQLFNYAPLDVVVAVVGNKADLSDQRTVSSKSGKDFASTRQYIFYETSAKTGTNIDELFTEIANSLRYRTSSRVSSAEDILKLTENKQKTRFRCCVRS